MSYRYNEAIKKYNKMEKSQTALDWYKDEFTKNTLPQLRSIYKDSSNPKECRNTASAILHRVDEINIEISELCKKENWKFLSLYDWTIKHNGIQQTIEQFQQEFGDVIESILSQQDEDASCPSM